MSYYYLEIVAGIEMGRRYLLADGAISLGRSSQNTIAMNSGEKSISSHHAIIYKSGNTLSMQDMQSTNGTYLNNEKVAECEIVKGDIVGLGKSGPRLKLVVSDTELSTQPVSKPKQGSPEPTNLRTIEDDVKHLKKKPNESTGHEDLEILTNIRLKMPKTDSFDLGSQTGEIEKKIVEKRLGANDMHSLLKDGKRLEKILDRGNVGQTQASMLRTMHGVHKKTNNQWVVILGIVIVVSLIAISFFAIRAHQYKTLLSKGMTLKSKLDTYENQIEQANKNPDANKRTLDSLIAELENAKSQLLSVKQNVHTNDVGKFYSDPLEKTIDEVLMRFGETDYHIPAEMVSRVKYHIGVYSGNLHGTIGKYIGRKERYFPMIKRIFRDNNVPQDLAYVSMLESGFNPRALSPVGARGIWQFMPKTGRHFNLRVDDQIDDRCDPEKATYAAAKYFRELIGIFGGQSSVMLAMAAYNAGEGRVMGALRKIDNPMRNRDFWYIYRMGYLAEETNEYIPRVIALLIISENLSQYNFTHIPVPPPEQVDSEKDFIPLDNFRNREQSVDSTYK